MFAFLFSPRAQGCSPLWQRFARTFFLLLCFSLSVMPAVAGSFELKLGRFTFVCNDDGTAELKQWEQSEDIKAVTIPDKMPAKGKAYQVIAIDERVFSGCSYLTSISLPAGLTTIGEGAFRYCSGLTSVSLPVGLTTIGEEAFRGCSGLTSVSLPAGLTTIGREVFSGCSGLTSVSLPAGLTTLGSGAFSGCSGLTSISLPAGLTTIGGGAFSGCSGLTSVSLPAGLTTIGGSVFSGCSGLTSVSLPAGLTTIEGYAFSGCSSLTSISLPAGLTTIEESAFSGCSSLTSVSFPDGLTTIGMNAFNGCSGLTSVSFPDGLTTIGWGAFYECSGLTSVSFPDGLTTIGGSAFEDCSGLTSVSFPDGLTTIGSAAFRFCSGLTSVSFPDGLTTIGWGAFNDCSNLSTLSLEGRVAPAIGDYEFYSDRLKEIHVPVDATYDTFDYIRVTKDLPIHTKIFDPLATYDKDSRIAAPITYKRRFTDTEWQPLYVPFALTTQELGEALEVAVLDEEQTGDEAIRFHRLKQGESLPEWSIALIRAKTVGKHVISLTNALLAAAEERIVSAGNYVFFGNLNENRFQKDETTIYLMEKDGFHLLTASDKKSGAKQIGALRWYMTPTATVPDTVRILVDGVPSAIEGIHIDDTTAPCYDLSGRRLEAAPEHGVYIQNGRKHIR